MKDKNEPIENKDEKPEEAPEEKPEELDPTRYGDWEKGGRCIDF